MTGSFSPGRYCKKTRLATQDDWEWWNDACLPRSCATTHSGRAVGQGVLEIVQCVRL